MIHNKPMNNSMMDQNLCQAVQFSTGPYLRCVFGAVVSHKYCALHLSYANVTDYVSGNEISIELPIEQTHNKTSCIIYKHRMIDSDNHDHIDNNCSPINKNAPKSSATLKEQQTKTVINSHQENEDDLEVKLLIMVNDDEYADKIVELIGPIFHDCTLSEDQEDPVTMDQIWTYTNGIKTATNINKYYLFSYLDSKSKIRCVTIFTMYDMIQNNDLVHPITSEPIPEKDIKRAKELIDLYDTKLNLFGNRLDMVASPEYRLKNKIRKLFNQFHAHSIFFEESWLTNIESPSQMHVIIRETNKLVKNNLSTINPGLTHLDAFKNPPAIPFPLKKSPEYVSRRIELQEYIVDGWIKIITASNNSSNQIPIWIIAHGLSHVVPEVKTKYPNLSMML